MVREYFMRIIDTKEIEECVYQMARRAGLTLTDSCRAALSSAKERETGAAEFALSALLENEKTAKREQMPVCQDTGMAVVLLSLGQEVQLVGAPLKDAVNEGVRRAYEDGKFRKSICDPLTRVNTGDNTPAHLHVEIEEGDKAEITYLGDLTAEQRRKCFDDLFSLRHSGPGDLPGPGMLPGVPGERPGP